jgi:hypothetical protein
MNLSFRNWLEAGGARFGGVEPPKQDPTKVGQGAFADFHGPEGTNAKDPDGQLPPNNRKKWLKKMKKKQRGS